MPGHTLELAADEGRQGAPVGVCIAAGKEGGEALLEVDLSACIRCGTCATDGYADGPMGSVVRKVHIYECAREMACERACPTRAIRLKNM